MERYLKYYIDFKNIYNDNCRVEIYGKTNTAPQELTGGADVFTIDYTVDNFVYNPSKFSGATLRVVGGDYLTDLYSNNYQDYKIDFLINNVIKWSGYITPEIYSQDYNTELFEIEIECISGLASLEFIHYDSLEAKTNLLELIQESLGKIDSSYNNVYFPNYYGKELNELEISCSNFYDEENKGMNYREILEHVCKFLNWTITEYNGDIYFIDYDYLIAGNESFIKYDKAITIKSIVNLKGSISVQECGFTGTDNTLSIQGGYNKAVVIASDYEIDGQNIIPDYKDKLTNTGVYDSIVVNSKNSDNVATQYHLEKTYYNSEYYYRQKYSYNGINKPRFSPISYNADGDYDDEYTIKLGTGGAIIKSFYYDINNKPNNLDIQTLIECRHNIINKDGTTNWAFLGQSSSGASESVKDYPIMTMKKTINYLKFDKNYIMGINFSLQFTGGNMSNREAFNFGHPDMYDVLKYSSDKYDQIQGNAGTTLYLAQLPMTIKIGDYYWNGTTWTTDKIVVMINVDRDKGINYMQPVQCKDEFTFEDGTDMEGYKIEFPDFPLEGGIEIEVYAPYFVNLGYPATSYIKDLTVKVEKKRDMRYADDDKEDTKYENEIDEKFVTEADDIEFKITSESESGLSLSKVFTTEGIIDKITDWRGLAVKPEERMIDRIVNQYNNPKIVLSQYVRDKILPYYILNDSYMKNKKFMWIGGEYNAKEDSLNVNMIEIK